MSYTFRLCAELQITQSSCFLFFMLYRLVEMPHTSKIYFHSDISNIHHDKDI